MLGLAEHLLQGILGPALRLPENDASGSLALRRILRYCPATLRSEGSLSCLIPA